MRRANRINCAGVCRVKDREGEAARARAKRISHDVSSERTAPHSQQNGARLAVCDERVTEPSERTYVGVHVRCHVEPSVSVSEQRMERGRRAENRWVAAPDCVDNRGKLRRVGLVGHACEDIRTTSYV